MGHGRALRVPGPPGRPPAQARGRGEYGSAGAGGIGAGRLDRRRGAEPRVSIALSGGQKKPHRRRGCASHPGCKSVLGRGGQRLSDAVAQATAPTEGGSGAQQGQGAGDSRWWRSGAKERLNRVTGAIQGPGTEQASEASVCPAIVELLKIGSPEMYPLEMPNPSVRTPSPSPTI